MKTRFVERLRRSQNDTANANGVAVIRMSFMRSGTFVLIDRITINGDSGAEAIFYVGSVADDNFVDFTSSPTRDVADNAKPIQVMANEDFICRVTGMTTGDIVTVRIEGRAFVVSRTSDSLEDRTDSGDNLVEDFKLAIKSIIMEAEDDSPEHSLMGGFRR